MSGRPKKARAASENRADNLEIPAENGDAQQQEVDRLRQQIAQMEQNAALDVPGKDAKKEVKTDYGKMIYDHLRKNHWRNYKFITHAEMETDFARLVGKSLRSDWLSMPLERRYAWAAKNAELITGQLNQVRSYVGSRMKDVAQKYWIAHGKTLMSSADIIRCMRRQINLGNPADLALFAWYWDLYLVRAAGNTHDWDKDKRHHQIITKAAPAKRSKKLYMDPSTEAFAALAFENYRKRWIAQWKLGEIHPGKRMEMGKMENYVNKFKIEDGGYVIKGKQLICVGEQFFAPYSKNDGGSDRLGGWEEAGLVKFMTYQKENVTARLAPGNLALEEKMLKHLRTEHGLDGAKVAAQSSHKKAEKALSAELLELSSSLYTFAPDDAESCDDEGEEQDDPPENATAV